MVYANGYESMDAAQVRRVGAWLVAQGWKLLPLQVDRVTLAQTVSAFTVGGDGTRRVAACTIYKQTSKNGKIELSWRVLLQKGKSNATCDTRDDLDEEQVGDFMVGPWEIVVMGARFALGPVDQVLILRLGAGYAVVGRHAGRYVRFCDTGLRTAPAFHLAERYDTLAHAAFDAFKDDLYRTETMARAAVKRHGPPTFSRGVRLFVSSDLSLYQHGPPGMTAATWRDFYEMRLKKRLSDTGFFPSVVVACEGETRVEPHREDGSPPPCGEADEASEALAEAMMFLCGVTS